MSYTISFLSPFRITKIGPKSILRNDNVYLRDIFQKQQQKRNLSLYFSKIEIITTAYISIISCAPHQGACKLGRTAICCRKELWTINLGLKGLHPHHDFVSDQITVSLHESI